MVFPASKMTGTCFFLHSGSVSFFKKHAKENGEKYQTWYESCPCNTILCYKEDSSELAPGGLYWLAAPGQQPPGLEPKEAVAPLI